MIDASLIRLRKRWMRWLGQKFRRGNDGWTDLLNTNLYCWATGVLHRIGFKYIGPNCGSQTLKSDTRNLFETAIYEANYLDLIRLDSVIVEYKRSNRAS